MDFLGSANDGNIEFVHLGIRLDDESFFTTSLDIYMYVFIAMDSFFFSTFLLRSPQLGSIQSSLPLQMQLPLTTDDAADATTLTSECNATAPAAAAGVSVRVRA